MAQALFALTATMDTTHMHAHHTATTARIGSLGEFSLVLGRGSGASESAGLTLIDASDDGDLVLTALDSAAVASDSTVTEVGSLDRAGVASLRKAGSEGDFREADADLPAAALDEAPAEVVSEAVADSMEAAATGNRRYSTEIGTAGSRRCQPFFVRDMDQR